MRRVISIATVLVFLVFVVACGSDGDSDSADDSGVPDPTTTVTETAESTTPETPTPTTTTTSEPTATPEPTPTVTPEPALWTSYPPPAAEAPFVVAIDVNPDGTTWALTRSPYEHEVSIPYEDEVSTYRLSRFEGDRWVTKPGPELTYPGPDLTSEPFLAAGPNGTAWVLEIRYPDEGEADIDLWQFDGTEWNVQSNPSGLLREVTWAIEHVDAGGDGVLWIGFFPNLDEFGEYDSSGMFHYDGTTWETLEGPPTAAFDLRSDIEGVVWSFTDEGIASFDGEVWTTYPRDPALGRYSGHGTVSADDWTMWAVLARGGELPTVIFDGEEWTLWPADTSSPEWAEAAALAQQVGPVYLAALGDQDLFTATSPSAGLIWFSVDGSARILTPEDGLPAAQITTLASGSDGVVWIGTTDGIARFDPAQYEASN